jgi:hypothetical protein
VGNAPWVADAGGYFAECLIVAARWRVRWLISSALRLFISGGKEGEIVKKPLSLCPTGANKDATKEIMKRAIMSPAASFQYIQLTETQ